MRKKDRTEEERHIDRLTKSGIMRLGAQPSQNAPSPDPFRYTFRWDRMGRKGQKCRLVTPGARIVLIEFEDGFRHVINKMAIRRDEC
jgi:hypothetical protein